MVTTALDHGMTPGYRVLPVWERLPADTGTAMVGVAVDSRDRVFVLTRRDARCIIYEPDGTFVRSFGEDVFTERIHALTIDGDDFVYTVDDGDHTVRKFSPDGALLMTLGTPGVPSDTGYDGKVTSSITRVGPPFNRPTKAAIGPNGDIFVSDGYGNARIHRFSSAGISSSPGASSAAAPVSSTSRMASGSPTTACSSPTVRMTASRSSA